jgi:hypothetical protein
MDTSVFIWIFTNIIISLLIIFVIHWIWSYLKDTYSTKKTKDLVNTQINKYKQIINELQENKGLHTSADIIGSMDDELTQFMENEII